MVQTSVLPARHEDLERVPAWLDHHLADKPIEHSNLVRPFLHWYLLRRARTRAGKNAYPTTAGRELRRRILVALDLLSWIDAQRTTLGELRQDDLESVSDFLCAGFFAVRFRMFIRCLFFALSDAVMPVLSGGLAEPGIPCCSGADAACPGYRAVLLIPGAAALSSRITWRPFPSVI
jgi:hypothetical protein